VLLTTGLRNGRTPSKHMRMVRWLLSQQSELGGKRITSPITGRVLWERCCCQLLLSWLWTRASCLASLLRLCKQNNSSTSGVLISEGTDPPGVASHCMLESLVRHQQQPCSSWAGAAAVPTTDDVARPSATQLHIMSWCKKMLMICQCLHLAACS